MSYLSEADEDALQDSGLSRETPFLIRGVTHGFFSIARFYGRAKYNGQDYTYLDATDELIRNDVLKWLKKRKRQVAALNKPE